VIAHEAVPARDVERDDDPIAGCHERTQHLVQVQVGAADAGGGNTHDGVRRFLNRRVGYRGNPVLIQSRFGAQGNFELVAPATDGGVLFMWRNNDDPALPWSAPGRFGETLGTVDEITMIQSNFGSPGNLE